MAWIPFHLLFRPFHLYPAHSTSYPAHTAHPPPWGVLNKFRCSFETWGPGGRRRRGGSGTRPTSRSGLVLLGIRCSSGGQQMHPPVGRGWCCGGGRCRLGCSKCVPTASSGGRRGRRSRGRRCGGAERIPVPSSGLRCGSGGGGTESVPSPVSSGRGGRRGTESTPASVVAAGAGAGATPSRSNKPPPGSRGGSRGGSHSGSHSGSRRDGSSTSVSPGRSVPCAVHVHLSVILGPDVLLHHRQRRARGFRPGREASLPVRVRAVVTHRLHVHHLFLLPRVQRRGPHERYVHAERAMDARAIRADEDAEVDGRPARLAGGAVW